MPLELLKTNRFSGDSIMNFIRKLLRAFCQNWTCWCNAKKEDTYPDVIEDLYQIPTETEYTDPYPDIINDTYNPKDNG